MISIRNNLSKEIILKDDQQSREEAILEIEATDKGIEEMVLVLQGQFVFLVESQVIILEIVKVRQGFPQNVCSNQVTNPGNHQRGNFGNQQRGTEPARVFALSMEEAQQDENVMTGIFPSLVE